MDSCKGSLGQMLVGYVGAVPPAEEIDPTTGAATEVINLHQRIYELEASF